MFYFGLPLLPILALWCVYKFIKLCIFIYFLNSFINNFLLLCVITAHSKWYLEIVFPWMELIILEHFFLSNCKPINSRRVIQSSYRPRQSNKITQPICRIFYVPFRMRINSDTFLLLLDSLLFYDLKWFMYLLKNCTAANLNNMIRITLVLLCCDIKSQFCDSFNLPCNLGRLNLFSMTRKWIIIRFVLSACWNLLKVYCCRFGLNNELLLMLQIIYTETVQGE